MTALLPASEESRLAALESYSIMDTEAEQAYDDITMLASFICDTPIALISLVDRDRQWFKSRVGLDTSETPREQAFCAHAILDPEEIMVVPDASLDHRFVDNPLVTGDPGIRFYAGAPLVTPSGEALGTVCVIDRMPRELDRPRLESLRALSRQVVTQLELRRAIADLRTKTEELERFQEQLERYQVELEASNAQMAADAGTDALTGVRNRRAFDQSLREEIERFRRSNRALSMLILDVDKFKSYNDEYGHVAGDDALRRVAQTVKEQARICDIVTRYGGEEFAVILPGTGVEGSIVVAERFRRAVERAAWDKRRVTVSIGGATATSEDSSETLTERADAALYQAKERGRNRCQHADQLSAV